MSAAESGQEAARQALKIPEGRPSPMYWWSSSDTSLAYELHRLVTHSILGKLMFRLHHYGVENLPEKGGFVLASNHQCYADPMLVGMGCKRQLCFLARANVFKIPLVGRWMSSMNVFPVEPGTADLGAIRKGIEIVSSERMLLVFPEGTRTEDGTIGTLKPGCILIAQKARVPIIPVAIRGAFEAWPRSRPLPGFGKVTISFGPHIDPGRTRQDLNSVQETLASEIQSLHDSMAWRYV